MYYFVSDIHLGAGNEQSAKRTEDAFCRWLDMIACDARALYLMGDIFDFWFEYHRVAPKGYVRVLARLAELTRKGVDVVFITGNHDMWCHDYFESECGARATSTMITMMSTATQPPAAMAATSALTPAITAFAVAIIALTATLINFTVAMAARLMACAARTDIFTPAFAAFALAFAPHYL